MSFLPISVVKGKNRKGVCPVICPSVSTLTADRSRSRFFERANSCEWTV